MIGPAAPDPVAAGAADEAGPDLEAGRRGIGQSNIPRESDAQVPSRPAYFVRVGDDPRGGMIRPLSGGRVQLATWGQTRTYRTVAEAMAAAAKTTPRPRPQKQKKLRPDEPRLAADGNEFIFESGRKVGAVTTTADGRTLGWGRDAALGEFASQANARAAVRSAVARKRK